MKITFLLIGGLIYIVFVLILYKASKNHKIKPVWVVLLSIFLTPLAGLIALLTSENGRLVTIERYVCDRCHLEHTENHQTCPHCKKEGYEITLRKVRYKSL